MTALERLRATGRRWVLAPSWCGDGYVCWVERPGPRGMASAQPFYARDLETAIEHAVAWVEGERDGVWP